MRRIGRIIRCLFVAVFSLTIGGLGFFISNSVQLGLHSKDIRESARGAAYDPNFAMQVSDRLVSKYLRYERLIDNYHLHKGMVVNRGPKGKVKDQCDSLLFSCLRYASLKKMGFQYKAEEAWLSIEKSQNNGHWYRHPDCRESTSRDMLLGVMVCMSAEPPRKLDHLKNLFSVIDENKGYFGDGPFYVSFLSPGLADILRRISKALGMKHIDQPDAVRSGYSTLEWDAAAGQDGYVSHLIALTTWLEMELDRKYQHFETRSFVHDLSFFTNLFADGVNPTKQRYQWTTQKLLEADEDNLFFQYLWYRSHNALTPSVRLSMMNDLLSMEQFPGSRLPTNCDRKADYLWQRHSREYRRQVHSDCSREFSGVDFLWMTSLLLEPLHSMTNARKGVERHPPATDGILID